MSTATETTAAQPATNPDPSGDDSDAYRAIHTGALLGLLVAIVSLVFPITVASFADMRQAALLGVVPVVGLLISLISLEKIRHNRDLYTGSKPAILGALLAAASLVGGGAYGGYVYATEVPEGYARTSFLEMKPDEVELAGNEPITPEVKALLGKKVFIKGFIRPDSTNRGLRKGITEFLLVRDNNECCFGDVSKVQFYDQLAVKMAPKKSADFSRKVFRVGGELSVRLGNVPAGEPPLVYELQADYIK